MHKAMAAPDTDGWRIAMDIEMENLCSHDMYEMVSTSAGGAPYALGGSSITSSRIVLLRRTRQCWSLMETIKLQASIMVNHSLLSCTWNPCTRSYH